jgi:hypothetical protein
MPDDSGLTLEKLLARLEVKAEEGYAKVTWTGRALSKSKEHLHVALPSGVVAIPLSEIESVSLVSAVRPDVIYVTVRNVDRVKHLLRVEQLESQRPIQTEGYQNDQDTATHSGHPHQPDACDDWIL